MNEHRVSRPPLTTSIRLPYPTYLFQVSRLLDRTPADLSGGERRRVEIAAAWIRAPRCLLADEPFSGINPSDAEVLAEAIAELAREGCAIV